VNKTIFCYEIDNTVLLGNLHGNREVVLRFRREEDIDSLFREGRIGCIVVNFDDVKLTGEGLQWRLLGLKKAMGITYFRPGSSAYSKGEKLGGCRSPIKFQFRKGSRVSFNRLANAALTAVELHRTLDLEGLWISRVPRDTNENQPFFIDRDAVVDNLSTSERGMSIENFRRGGSGIRDAPVEYGSISSNTDSRVRYPFPKDNILVDYMRLDFRLGFDVEYLELSLS
jgi:hypothetical protein